jgi:hypothetical protein
MHTDAGEAAAERAVLDYLTDRHAWEREAWKLGRSRKATTAWPEVKATIRDGYAALLERHCAPRVIALGLLPAYGDPPTANPAGVRFVSSSRQGAAIKVITEEDIGDGLGATTYEYEIVELNGRLRLAERRGRVPNRRAIRDVW